MEFRLLGEVQVRAAGLVLDVGTPRQQAVLAALAVDAGRPVAVETLVDRVWDDAPPVEARNALYSHVSRIRRLLREAATLTGGPVARVERRHAGYVLDVDPELVDLHRFTKLLEQGRDQGRSGPERAGALAAALGLWRGTPLAALSGEWVAQVRDSWHRQRLEAAVQWAQVELRLGHPATVIGALADLVAEYPLVEPVEALLMRALHAAGRSAEALDRYTAVRRRLTDELGTDPGPELRALHQAILRDELPPPPVDNQEHVSPGDHPAPAQLPPDVYGFAGRDRELAHLDGVLGPARGRSGSAVIAAIAGTAGIGKTALAVRWAHRVADRFPDGQVYVNLRGFDPAGPPVTPLEAVRGFLDAFAVPPERIPAGLDAQVGLYRSVLAGRRVLVLLDNARDADQVRPLLPGAPGCLAVVTSRNQLTGLVAAAGAHLLTLELPGPAEARDMLAGRVGPERVAAEPRAVEEIIARCARLPLAMVVVAARAAAHPGFGLAALAAELRAAGGGLDEFAGSDPATDVRAVFSWSYRQLGAEAARLFRLLGLHPGPDIGRPAAASLAGVPAGAVRPLLAELTRAHLLTEHTPGRYSLHDLLRAYAAELAGGVDTEPERHAAVHRLLSHYVHTAHRADRLLSPHRDDPVTLEPVAEGAHPERLTEHSAALTWFAAEHPVLQAAIRQTTGFDAHVCELAWALQPFLGYQGRWHDGVDVVTVFLDAARRLPAPGRQALAHRLLGCSFVALDRYDDAGTHLRHALDLYRQAGDEVGAAHAHRLCAWMLDRQGRHREALVHAELALAGFRAAGHRPGQARSLNAVGWFHALLGDHEQALARCRQALDLQEELGDRPGQAETWDSLGYSYHRLGRYARAVACYENSVALYREFDDRYNLAATLACLGDAHYAAGDLDSAGTAWRHGLAVFERLGHPAADDFRARLTKLAEPRPGAVTVRGDA
jgi:DNA-binding SARP family transcriptional activator/tetratricopeptide (TPR) repeat protein